MFALEIYCKIVCDLGVIMLACKGIFATPSIDTAVARPQKDFKLLGILRSKILLRVNDNTQNSNLASQFYQEQKMLACKGIFATPSIDTAVARPQKAFKLLGILRSKILLRVNYTTTVSLCQFILTTFLRKVII